MHEITKIYYYIGQDLPVALLVVLTALVFATALMRASHVARDLALPLARFGQTVQGYERAMWVCAGAAGLGSLLIGVLVMQSFPLSIDEKMVFFDAEIFARGVLAAPIPPEMRDLLDVLVRPYVKLTPDRSLEHSMYLPLNAMLHVPFIRLGLPTLIDALMVAGTIAVTFDITRKLLPDHPEAALFGAVLLASSPQILITGATVYAMNAHLLVDMLWLRLMMSERRLAWAGGFVLALLASGLHQWAYFPVFAAGFMWEWLRARDYPRLLLTGAGALVGVLVWSRYRHYSLPDFWTAAMPAGGNQTLMEQAETFGSALAPSIALVLEHLTAPAEAHHQADLMVFNLFRFVVWQNPMVWLAVIAGYPLWKSVPMVRAIMLSMLAMTVITTAFVPFQGHGWGYRYLHHFLGGLSLCAAYGYRALQQDLVRLPLIVGAVLVRVRFWTKFTLLVVLPCLLAVSGYYNWFYLRIDREISTVRADYILVDTIDIPYSFDFVFNDPFLIKPPFRLNLGKMDLPMIDRICAKGTVHLYRARTLFDSSDARRKAELPDEVYRILDPESWRQKGCRLVDAKGDPLP